MIDILNWNCWITSVLSLGGFFILFKSFANPPFEPDTWEELVKVLVEAADGSLFSSFVTFWVFIVGFELSSCFYLQNINRSLKKVTKK
jgi:hypothetical protein